MLSDILRAKSPRRDAGFDLPPFKYDVFKAGVFQRSPSCGRGPIFSIPQLFSSSSSTQYSSVSSFSISSSPFSVQSVAASFLPSQEAWRVHLMGPASAKAGYVRFRAHFQPSALAWPIAPSRDGGGEVVRSRGGAPSGMGGARGGGERKKGNRVDHWIHIAIHEGSGEPEEFWGGIEGRE